MLLVLASEPLLEIVASLTLNCSSGLRLIVPSCSKSVPEKSV